MDLSDAELSEEVIKVLSTENRHLPQNQVIYSFKDGGYVPIKTFTNVITIFETEGTAIHIESQEAKAQIARDGDIGYDPRIADLRSQGASASGTGTNTPDLDIRDKSVTPNDDAEEPEGGEGSEAGAGAEPEAEAEEEGVEKPVGTPGGPKKKLTNQFNFCERAALTYS
jgi:dynein intermediate chain 1, axonemal